MTERTISVRHGANAPAVDRMKSEFHKTIKQLSRRHHTWQVFADFCQMAALSL